MKYIVVVDEGSIIFSVGGTNCYSIEALRLICDIKDGILIVDMTFDEVRYNAQ